MTVVTDDRIEAAVDDEQTLDEIFQLLERMPVPEGYKVDIVEGAIHMSPQRDTHWEIILELAFMLRSHFGRSAKLFSDVRIDFPGDRNGFCPDLAKFREGAVRNDKGRWLYQDVEFIVEVISRDTATNDYGPKKAAYATAEVPVYLVVDPYQRKCHVYTQPKDGEFVSELTLAFGVEIDLTDTPVGLKIATDAFPHD
ncbi:hypothetical protein SRB5_31460 [Streptomyces sp. RB5]|uniref:Putative restriction endonuclease domain-containing protein n=1 Tax=Streptomyces smaragdinus TaxID=2585196 RepID=A0A7K0CHV3_9ACTN|nr:Uma2 family endonuclease [Streptomyces smaragdinus]MQY13006.1 hypothetical protein [Streptomyces smaragdinus]